MVLHHQRDAAAGGFGLGGLLGAGPLGGRAHRGCRLLLLAAPHGHPGLREFPALRQALPRHYRTAQRLFQAAHPERTAQEERPGGRGLRRGQGHRPHLEAALRRLLLHRVRPLRRELPHLRHRQAAHPQAAQPDHQTPPARRGAHPALRQGRGRKLPPLVGGPSPPRQSGPARLAAGARRPARSSSRTCRASWRCAATRCRWPASFRPRP